MENKITKKEKKSQVKTKKLLSKINNALDECENNDHNDKSKTKIGQQIPKKSNGIQNNFQREMMENIENKDGLSNYLNPAELILPSIEPNKLTKQKFEERKGGINSLFREDNCCS